MGRHMMHRNCMVVQNRKSDPIWDTQGVGLIRVQCMISIHGRFGVLAQELMKVCISSDAKATFNEGRDSCYQA